MKQQDDATGVRNSVSMDPGVCTLRDARKIAR